MKAKIEIQIFVTLSFVSTVTTESLAENLRELDVLQILWRLEASLHLQLLSEVQYSTVQAVHLSVNSQLGDSDTILNHYSRDSPGNLSHIKAKHVIFN